MHGVWLPQYKWQLVNQLYQLYAGKYSKSQLNRINKRRLYGMRLTKLKTLKTNNHQGGVT